MTPIELRPLIQIQVTVDAPPQLVGAVPHGYTRRVMCVSGGQFEGGRLRGRVLPGGADVVLERPDGGLHLDVRLVLETYAGEIIYMTYNGRRNGSSPEKNHAENCQPRSDSSRRRLLPRPSAV